MEYAQILKEKYPEIAVNGEYYEPPGLYSFYAKLLVRFPFSKFLPLCFARLRVYFCLFVFAEFLTNGIYHRCIIGKECVRGVRIENSELVASVC